MGTTKNIEMREYNRSDYNLLLPKTDSYTKEETLANYTKNLLKLTESAVPDDAFLALFLGADAYAYRVRVQLSDGTPVSGSTISGLSAVTGQTLTTGDDGIVLGKSTSESVTINCTSPYIDQKPPAAQTFTKTGKITDVTLTLENVTDMITVTSSKTPKVSPMAKTVDVTAVGGGGGGGSGTIRYSNSNYGGAGGGGGYVSTSLNVPISVNEINITIGAGGKSGRPAENNKPGGNGSQGGISTISLGEIVVSANGGGGGEGAQITRTPPPVAQGGDGNGKGGQGAWDTQPPNTATAGGNGTKYIFDDSSLGLAGGGGGGGGQEEYGDKVCAGGNPGGASGAKYAGGSANAGEAKLGGGGGGRTGFMGAASNGGNGVAYLRFHFDVV